MKTVMFIVDPQNDFCLPPGNRFGLPEGALRVVGADEDMERLAQLILSAVQRIDDIHVTLDSHLPLHIAHQPMWMDANGNPPPLFTIMSEEGGEVFGHQIDPATGNATMVGTFRTIKPMMFTDPVTNERLPWGVHYCRTLKANGRYALCIWPMHCLIGSVGAAVYPTLFEALNEWQLKRKGFVNYVPKGSNFRTEHYSAAKADVEDQTDPGTQMNMDLVNLLADPDIEEIVTGGEALSHCVAETWRDIAKQFGQENVKKVTILTDTCSNVGGFEANGDAFLKDFVAMGARTCTTKEWLA